MSAPADALCVAVFSNAAVWLTIDHRVCYFMDTPNGERVEARSEPMKPTTAQAAFLTAVAACLRVMVLDPPEDARPIVFGGGFVAQG